MCKYQRDFLEIDVKEHRLCGEKEKVFREQMYITDQNGRGYDSISNCPDICDNNVYSIPPCTCVRVALWLAESWMNTIVVQ